MKKTFSTADLLKLSPDEAKTMVEKCWDNINSANPYKGPKRPLKVAGRNKSKSPLGTVRVFVSSTFKDFFSEREILVKQVFPELREWCHKKGIAIIDVDLRWGVPPNKSTTDTISICFEELQRCSKESDNYPFFIGLIGQRYGWIPENEEITDDVRSNYNWVKSVSITHMEILHGAFWQNLPNPNAMFFFRGPIEPPEEYKENGLPDFVDDNNFSREHLKQLKSHIQQRYPESCLDYDADFDGCYENQQVRLSGLEDFAEKVKTMLMSSIEHQLSLRSSDTVDPETKPHWNYVVTTEKQSFVGRQKELGVLRKFIGGAHPEDLGLERCIYINGSSPNTSLDKKSKATKLSPDRKPLLWVCGPKAVGKSALLAKFVAEMKQYQSVEVFYHFERAAPDASNIRCLLRRFLRFMNHPFARNKHNNEINNENFMKVASSEQGPNIISELEFHLEEKKDKTFVFIIEGIDKMPEVLKWLPEKGTVKNCFTIISGDSCSKQVSKLLGQNYAYKMDVGPLNKEEQFQLRLDDKQTKLLLKKDRCPDWLSLALEELRVFGIMQKLNAKIETLPDSVEDLAWDIISRLITEDNTEQKLIEKVHCFILSHPRFLHMKCHSVCIPILGQQVPLLRAQSTMSPGKDTFDREEIFSNMPFSFEKSVPYIIWAQVQRTMRAFLRYNSDGTITFSSESVKKVVLTRLLSDDAVRSNCHELLAIYFSKSYSDSMNFWQQFSCLCRIAYHVSETKKLRNLLRFYRKDPRANKFPPPLRLEHFIKNTCQAPASDKNATVCSCCLPRFVQQCVLCKSSIHSNEGHSCISISTNARHSACFNPTPVKLCEEHVMTSKKRCIICGGRDTTILCEAYICCECAGQRSEEVKEKCCYFLC